MALAAPIDSDLDFVGGEVRARIHGLEGSEMRSYVLLALLAGCSSEAAIDAGDMALAITDAAVAMDAKDIGSKDASADLRMEDLATAVDMMTMPDLRPDLRSEDMTPTDDLATQCTPTGASCSAETNCCLKAIADPPQTANEFAFCSSNKCCSLWFRYGGQCAGGHFRTCTDCGLGAVCGNCN
jgi:hypothetical protein